MPHESEPVELADIMIVDDNDIMREGLAIIIRKAGYRVSMFANGQQALDALSTGNHPDLVILDMLMPVMDGWRFLRELGRWPTPHQFPIIIITGAVLGEEWPEAHGCAAFLQKPFESEQLLAEIRRCLAE